MIERALSKLDDALQGVVVPNMTEEQARDLGAAWEEIEAVAAINREVLELVRHFLGRRAVFCASDRNQADAYLAFAKGQDIWWNNLRVLMERAP